MTIKEQAVKDRAEELLKMCGHYGAIFFCNEFISSTNAIIDDYFMDIRIYNIKDFYREVGEMVNQIAKEKK